MSSQNLITETARTLIDKVIVTPEAPQGTDLDGPLLAVGAIPNGSDAESRELAPALPDCSAQGA